MHAFIIISSLAAIAAAATNGTFTDDRGVWTITKFNYHTTPSGAHPFYQFDAQYSGDAADKVNSCSREYGGSPDAKRPGPYCSDPALSFEVNESEKILSLTQTINEHEVIRGEQKFELDCHNDSNGAYICNADTFKVSVSTAVA
ncbi:uncharacterized protein K452DRAFT_322084 [Aplosporella prunicola CBS 121167]|uniref:AA1-like domain-containing protein n=1 Tax=Aplosporella prunicola CBS 121167 TaxID=1176127 RepID=A0A6A6AYS5_9PEZI|nr:uncharacterized protein K452DRAFT_322084 [Aplosporella prunicola CBS 121167]KAF2136930.1 hypothetical protein K452DRAFT_322084 [Aplosporella prunicola CBS 121167]